MTTTTGALAPSPPAALVVEGAPGAKHRNTSAIESLCVRWSESCCRFDGEESEGEDLMDADVMRRDYQEGRAMT